MPLCCAAQRNRMVAFRPIHRSDGHPLDRAWQRCRAGARTAYQRRAVHACADQPSAARPADVQPIEPYFQRPLLGACWFLETSRSTHEREYKMISLDPAHAAVYYPADRRFRIWIRPSFLVAIAALVLLPVLLAWVQLLAIGLPYIPPVTRAYPDAMVDPQGFPAWVRYCHFFNRPLA